MNRAATGTGCALCRDARPLAFDFSYAFQPIVDVQARSVFAHEALVRGTTGEPAASVLSQVTADNRYAFDQACREKAIRIAGALDLPSHLSINFLPNAIYRPELCIRSTLQAARQHGFPVGGSSSRPWKGSRSTTASGWPRSWASTSGSASRQPLTTSAPGSPG